MIPKKTVMEAAQELQDKTFQEIEEETAIKWGARALAAYAMFAETRDLRWLCDAVEYHHEAVEHAADTSIAEDIARILGAKRSEIASLR